MKMAVAKSSTHDKPSKSEKSSSKVDKTTFLLAQDVKYARNLAANEEKVRRKSLKYLTKYLGNRSEANALQEENLQVLWKGLFYSMWMSDKPLIQEECAESIAKLLHCLKFKEALLFFKVGLITLQNEWFGIDQLRINKFFMFVRRLLRQALVALSKENFKRKPNEAFAKVLEETILSTTTSAPLGLQMHFIEIYLEELAKVSEGKLHVQRTLDLLQPFILKLAFSEDERIIKWINKFIFTYLIKQHKLGIEYEEKYEVWKQHGFKGSINQVQKVVLSDDEEETESDEEHIEEDQTEKPLDPRAGRVDVELAEIPFNSKAISDSLLALKTNPRTFKNTRYHLITWSEKFLKLSKGVYPLGDERLDNKKVNNDVDMNPTKAAKRLIKFEQKLMSRDKKRRRDESEPSEEEPKLKKQKTKKTAKLPEKKTKLNGMKDDNQMNIVDIGTDKAIKKTGTKSLKKKLKQTGLTKSDVEFCFVRNSGVWYVTKEEPTKNISGLETLKNNVVNNQQLNGAVDLKNQKKDETKKSNKLKGKNRVGK